MKLFLRNIMGNKSYIIIMMVLSFLLFNESYDSFKQAVKRVEEIRYLINDIGIEPQLFIEKGLSDEAALDNIYKSMIFSGWNLDMYMFYGIYIVIFPIFLLINFRKELTSGVINHHLTYLDRKDYFLLKVKENSVLTAFSLIILTLICVLLSLFQTFQLYTQDPEITNLLINKISAIDAIVKCSLGFIVIIFATYFYSIIYYSIMWWSRNYMISLLAPLLISVIELYIGINHNIITPIHVYLYMMYEYVGIRTLAGDGIGITQLNRTLVDKNWVILVMILVYICVSILLVEATQKFKVNVRGGK